MVDTRSPEQRRRIMQSIRSKNTGPEQVVRSVLHGLGLRFRLHRKDLPGTPDIVLPGRGAVVFVHGCYWHGHGCSKGQPPKSRTEFWLPKLKRNKERDAEKERALSKLGWKVITIWQCETSDTSALRRKLRKFFGRTKKRSTTPKRI
jgi:DNA mismatch endonuclease (patch repair protein)